MKFVAMIRQMTLAAVLGVLCGTAILSAAEVKESAMRIPDESRLGIDVRSPRLSWVIQSDRRGEMQTAYQVLVASSPDLLAQDQGDLWDSGKVESDRSTQIEYSGKRLASHQPAYWKVKVWDAQGRDGCFQRTGLVVHGLFEPGRVESEVDRTR